MTPYPLSAPPAPFGVGVPTDVQALDAWAAWERHLDAGRIAVRTPPPDSAILARRLRTEAQFVALRERRA